MTLSSEKKRELRKQTSRLKPIVIIGNHGLTPNVQQEIEQALEHHELIKIRVNAETREARHALIETICQQSRAHMIQAVGHIVVIYRHSLQKN